MQGAAGVRQDEKDDPLCIYCDVASDGIGSGDIRIENRMEGSNILVDKCPDFAYSVL